MTDEIDDLLHDTAIAGRRAIAARDGARARAVETIRDLELRLREAIAGERLRGLVNLLMPRERGVVFRGARVRGRDLFEPLPVDRPVLVVTEEGELAMAKRYVDEDGIARALVTPAADAELIAEDLGDVVRVVRAVLLGHLEANERTTRRYDGVSALVERLQTVLAA